MKNVNLLTTAVLDNQDLLIESFVSPSNLHRDMSSVLQRVSSEGSSATLRTYVNRGVRDDLTSKIKNAQFPVSADIHSWLSSITESDDYCFVINQVEKWSLSISEFFIENIIRHWIDDLGVQILGFEIFSFIGKYEQTPFGIHEDQDHTILLNLGPNNIDAWIWKKEVYLEKVKPLKATFDVSGLDTYGKHIIFKPGDLLFIPKGDYHAFKREEFSITIGLIPVPFLPRKVIEKFILSKVSTRLLNSNHLDYLKIDLFDEFANNYGIELAREVHKLNFAQMLKSYHLRLSSNGYLANSYININNVYDSFYLSNRRRTHCPIRVMELEEGYYNIFINGNELTLKMKPSVLKLIDELNQNDKLELESSLQLLESDIAANSAKQLIKLFQQYLY